MKQFPIPLLMASKGSLKLRNPSLMLAAVHVIMAAGIGQTAGSLGNFGLLDADAYRKAEGELAQRRHGLLGFLSGSLCCSELRPDGVALAFDQRQMTKFRDLRRVLVRRSTVTARYFSPAAVRRRSGVLACGSWEQAEGPAGRRTPVTGHRSY